MQEKLTLSVDEAARAMGVSRNLMWEMVWTGRVQTIRLGRRVLVPRKALDRLLEEAGRPRSRGGGQNKAGVEAGQR